MKRLLLTLLALGWGIGLGYSLLAQAGPPQDNIIDGTQYPESYTPPPLPKE